MRGPLVLGAGGRVGTMWRRLAAQGLWPEPVWHTRDGRDGTLAWDMGGPPPPWRAPPGGLVVLARGDEPALARAALALAARDGSAPVLLASSQAAYGDVPQPCREDGPALPSGAYGRAKLALEAEASGACALRIGNVAGAGALFDAMAAGPVTLDRLPDGSAPRRQWVGPLALGPLLNLAQPGLVPMDAVLRAAGVPFAWRDNPAALPSVEMDLSRLQALAPLPPATPETLVSEARLAGWRPHGEAP